MHADKCFINVYLIVSDLCLVVASPTVSFFVVVTLFLLFSVLSDVLKYENL